MNSYLALGFALLSVACGSEADGFTIPDQHSYHVTDSALVRPVQRALARWERASGVKRSLDGSGIPISFEYGSLDCRGTSEFLSGADPHPCRGATAKVEEGQEGAGKTLWIKIQADQLGTPQFQIIVDHEIGHSLGIMNHLPGLEDLMYESAEESLKFNYIPKITENTLVALTEANDECTLFRPEP